MVSAANEKMLMNMPAMRYPINPATTQGKKGELTKFSNSGHFVRIA
jgi:hypothetical protein